MRRIFLTVGIAALLVLPVSAAGHAAATTVNVSTASQLTTALANAAPGQTIVMADGTHGSIQTNSPARHRNRSC